ncbi:MAG: hypothetical protein AVDCRST_MAG38-1556, partial [uncultured Solirubrobacteraceae bacterium]
ARGRPAARRAGGRSDGSLVALRPVDGRDAGGERIRRAPAHVAAGVCDLRGRGAGRRSGHLRRPGLAGRGTRSGHDSRAAGRRRPGARRRARRAARPAHRAPGPSPGPRVVAPDPAGAGRGGPLRGPARPGLHHLHPHLRRLGPGGTQRRGRRARPRRAGGPGLRRGTRAAGDRPGPGRRQRRRRPDTCRHGRAARHLPAPAAARRRGDDG